MSDIVGDKKFTAIEAIKRNLATLNLVVLLIVWTLFFLNIRFLYKILDYVPSVSIVLMLTIIAGLVIINLFLARLISTAAIKELNNYDRRLSSVLNSMQQEVRDRKEIEKKLERQAYYDQLTNLPNRTMFTKRLNRVSKRPKQHPNYLFAVLFLDLDSFKVVNDSLGHIIGDELLISLAQRLKKCVRTVDTVARFGGDEFAILLDDIDKISDAFLVADRILRELKSPFKLNGHDMFISASIGIAPSTMNYEEAENFLRDADIAMYRAKVNGKARYEMFDSEMHNSILERLSLETDLRQAAENEEFLIYYQPIISLKERKIIGAEALIRWRHPQHGFIPPLKFIPLAEDIGLITKIGEWVFRTACVQNKAWHNSGHQYLRMDVNFSARQFQEQDISIMIEQVLQETDIDAQFLGIEITESIAMEDHSVVVLNKLSAMGINLTIDDFGTGYSSLGALKRFPINAIKIDKSFIKDITKDPDIEAIVKAIIAMAHTLRIKVVAEGVETKGQSEFLHLHNCDEIQGYLFSPPVPEQEFAELLGKRLFIAT